MAEETKRSISEMPTQATPATGDLFEVAVVNAQSQTGYSSYKESLAAIADAIAGNFQYPLLLTQTTAKTLAGAINELAQSSGGGGHTYSTTEQVVGEWIDGSTLYEKTVSFGALPDTNTKTVAHGISGFDVIFIEKAFAMDTSGGYYIELPYSVASVGGGGGQIYLTSTDIEVTTPDDYSDYTQCYVTIRYTKASS